jgi:flavin reductase
MNTPDKQTFRDAMACVGAAVNIITTDGPAGMAGFTASAVCSVTDSPPTLLVCLNRGASVWPTFSENRTLCVNTLSAGQEPLSNLFGGKTPMEDRFAAARWKPAKQAARVLRMRWPRLTVASARWSAWARTTSCFATLFR